MGSIRARYDRSRFVAIRCLQCEIAMDEVQDGIDIKRKRGSGNASEDMDLGDGTDAFHGVATGALAGRRDGRSTGEMRGLKVTQDFLSQADGSGRICVGKTEVLAAVYGPTDCPVNKQNVDRAILNVVWKFTSDENASSYENDVEELFSGAVQLEANPRKALAVIVHVVSDEGGVLAAAINAVSIALLDSGVPMKYFPTAAAIAITAGELLVDPDKPEEAEAEASSVFAFSRISSTETGALLVRVYGDVGGDHLFRAACSIAQEVSLKTCAFLKSAVGRKIQMTRQNLYPGDNATAVKEATSSSSLS